MKRLLAVLALAALLATAAQGFAAAKPKVAAAPAAAPSALRMEDLEVRGLKEKPEVLYAPVLRGVDRPSPIRYDLFLVDMNRPVSPVETGSLTPPAGDNSILRRVP